MALLLRRVAALLGVALLLSAEVGVVWHPPRVVVGPRPRSSATDARAQAWLSPWPHLRRVPDPRLWVHLQQPHAAPMRPDDVEVAFREAAAPELLAVVAQRVHLLRVMAHWPWVPSFQQAGTASRRAALGWWCTAASFARCARQVELANDVVPLTIAAEPAVASDALPCVNITRAPGVWWLSSSPSSPSTPRRGLGPVCAASLEVLWMRVLRHAVALPHTVFLRHVDGMDDAVVPWLVRLSAAGATVLADGTARDPPPPPPPLPLLQLAAPPLPPTAAAQARARVDRVVLLRMEPSHLTGDVAAAVRVWCQVQAARAQSLPPPRRLSRVQPAEWLGLLTQCHECLLRRSEAEAGEVWSDKWQWERLDVRAAAAFLRASQCRATAAGAA